jgi:hypothetical protein
LREGRSANEALERNFAAKGWCFVRLPELMLINQATELPKLRAFFNDQSGDYKARFAERSAYGYSAPAEHKESYRVLTGRRLLSERPAEFDWLAQFAADLDATVLTLLTRIGEKVFKKKPHEVAQLADLPVSFLRESHFGMLDFVRYHNSEDDPARVPLPEGGGGASVAEVNCVPHYDPGLISVSFFSDRAGLQLLEPVLDASGHQVGERWVDGPINTIEGQESLGVLWLGEAAVKLTDGRLKAGVHRVIYPSSAQGAAGAQARLTSWYEVCTTTQAKLDDGEGATAQDKGVLSLPNVLSSLPLAFNKGETKGDFLRKVERVYGIPMSKIMREADFFKSKKIDQTGDKA